jgi:hypothetical protein
MLNTYTDTTVMNGLMDPCMRFITVFAFTRTVPHADANLFDFLTTVIFVMYHTGNSTIL